MISSKENVPSFSTKKPVSKEKGSASKKDNTPLRKFGLQSPNVSNMSGVSGRSGEQAFFTPTGTIEISIDGYQESPESSKLYIDPNLNNSVDISSNVMRVFSDRRMTVDAVTALGIINDLEKAQLAMR